MPNMVICYARSRSNRTMLSVYDNWMREILIMMPHTQELLLGTYDSLYHSSEKGNRRVEEEEEVETSLR